MELDDILPAKQPGKHRWLAVVLVHVTDEEVVAAAAGEYARTTADKIATGGIVSCADCHLPYDIGSTWECES